MLDSPVRRGRCKCLHFAIAAVASSAESRAGIMELLHAYLRRQVVLAMRNYMNDTAYGTPVGRNRSGGGVTKIGSAEHRCR